MKIITLTLYQCEICGQKYESEIEARECEARPITQDKGVKVGDKVLITYGDGTGNFLLVEKISIIKKENGVRYFERYWHTVEICGDVIEGNGGRCLSWDQYEVL